MLRDFTKWTRQVANLLLRFIAKGLMAKLAGYGMMGLGFWLLYLGFGGSTVGAGIGWGVGGAALILGGMYLMVSLGRGDSISTLPQPGAGAGTTKEEVSPFDPVDGSDQSG